VGIKRATLYYRSKDKLDKKIKEAKIKNKIVIISRKHPYYGYLRMTASLRRDQVIVNHRKILKIMNELGLQSRVKRKYITATNSKHHNKIYSNLFKDNRLPVLTKSGVRISPISGYFMVLFTYQPS
jgi:putative transposase